jgi:hypothetical protein
MPSLMRRPGQDHFRVVADFLGLVGQIIGIDADAMAADQARPERQEIPLGAGGEQYFFGIDAQALEQQRQFVDQGDIDVALGVFDHLGGFRHADAGGAVSAGGNDAPIQCVHERRRFRCGA